LAVLEDVGIARGWGWTISCHEVSPSVVENELILSRDDSVDCRLNHIIISTYRQVTR